MTNEAQQRRKRDALAAGELRTAKVALAEGQKYAAGGDAQQAYGYLKVAQQAVAVAQRKLPHYGTRRGQAHDRLRQVADSLRAPLDELCRKVRAANTQTVIADASRRVAEDMRLERTSREVMLNTCLRRAGWR